jgi:hypothetical protein
MHCIFMSHIEAMLYSTDKGSSATAAARRGGAIMIV